MQRLKVKVGVLRLIKHYKSLLYNGIGFVMFPDALQIHSFFNDNAATVLVIHSVRLEP